MKSASPVDGGSGVEIFQDFDEGATAAPSVNGKGWGSNTEPQALSYLNFLRHKRPGAFAVLGTSTLVDDLRSYGTN